MNTPNTHFDAVVIDKSGQRPTTSPEDVLSLTQAIVAFETKAQACWVRLEPSEDIRLLASFIQIVLGVEVHFPTFRDGRGYSTARILRDDMGFKGPVRAVGDVYRDQLFVMMRSGFDQFALKDKDPEAAILAASTRFSSVYQAASDDVRPVWMQRLAK